MSRGGGGRGGRGGWGGRPRGGSRALKDVPWASDPSIEHDGKPSELFPPYDVPEAAVPTRREERQVAYFLLFREQVHDGPLYTQARTWHHGEQTARTYGQDQINQRYSAGGGEGGKGGGSGASGGGGGGGGRIIVDPFLAVPTYSQRFQRPERALPDLASRPFAKEYFPEELHATLDGDDGGGSGAAKRRRVGGVGGGAGAGKKALALSNITALRTAEDIFLAPELKQEQQDPAAALGDAASYNKALQMLDKVEKNGEDGGDGGGGEDLLLGEDDDDDWVKTNDGEDGEDGDAAEEEDQYDDESGDDYNAEQYFEGNQDDDDYDDGGGDDGGGGDYY